jgi:hypothetical protein
MFIAKRFIPILCVLAAAEAQPPSAEDVINLAKTFFRDSAEIPMDVSVTKTILNPAGSVRRETHATARMLFHGYNKAGRFTVSAKAGGLGKGTAIESMSGDLAAFASGVLLLRERNAAFEILPAARPGEALSLRVEDRACPPFRLLGERMLFPPSESFCGSSTFTVRGESAADRTFSHFTFLASSLPARGKIADLGDIEIRAFQIDEDFQESSLPGDAKPFLLPKRVRISIRTDKGEIEVTNEYMPHLKS